MTSCLIYQTATFHFTVIGKRHSLRAHLPRKLPILLRLLQNRSKYKVTMVTESKIPLTESQGSLGYYRHEIWVTSILQIIGGLVLAALGIGAIFLTAWWSYFSTPIWTGIMIFLVTGSIGVSASNSYSYSLTQGFASMSLVGVLAAGSVIGMNVYVAALEDDGAWWYNGTYWVYSAACQPGAYDTYIYNCDVSAEARQAIDGFIVVIGVFLFCTCMSGSVYGFKMVNGRMTSNFQQMKTSGKDAFVVASPDGSLRLLTGAVDLKGESGMQVLREATVVYCLPEMGAHSLPAAAPPYSLPSDDAKAPLTPSIPDPDPQA